MILFIWATIFYFVQATFIVIAKDVPVGFKSIQKCREYQAEINIDLPSRIDESPPKPDPDRVIFARDTSPRRQVLQYPYAASLHGANGILLCGANLISDRFILAAAHCMKNRKEVFKKSIIAPYNGMGVELAQLGSDIVHYHESNLRNISRIIPHPGYTNKQHYNDIGLVELAESVRFSSSIRPACLQARRSLANDDWFMLTWKRGNEQNKYTKSRFSVKAKKLDDCQKTYQDQSYIAFGVIDHLQMCIEEEIDETIRHTPISVVSANKDTTGFTVVATPSIGLNVRRIGQVYTRVSGYIRWIESVVWPENVANGCNSFHFDI